MNERERIGQTIYKIRKKKGLTQLEIANKTGLDRGHIARIEQGKFNVGIDTLSKITDALGCEIIIREKPL